MAVAAMLGVVLSFGPAAAAPAPEAGLPNFAPYTPPGWSGPLVVTTTKGSRTDATSFGPTADVFVNWCFINDGSADATTRTYFHLFVDGALFEYFYFEPPLQSGHYFFWRDIELGVIGGGTHTIEMIADATEVIPESDEDDNTITRTIFVNLHSRNAAGTTTQNPAMVHGR